MKNYSPKILLTGGSGQLAQAIFSHNNAANFHLKMCSRDELDITSMASISRAIQDFSPEIIINCAAYTAVDQAENSRGDAEKINHLGAKNLAISCKKNQIFLLHLSTDYVFNGLKLSPYIEDDLAQPINIYGESKLAGENAIREYGENYVILRVSGVVSEFGHNFLKTMLKLAREREKLRIVNDQITCPTAADDIAGALFEIARTQSHIGIYHYCSTPPVSWHDFAVAIINEARKYEPLRVQNIQAITTSDYPTPAKRPLHSVLDCAKIRLDFNIAQPSWELAIQRILKRIYT